MILWKISRGIYFTFLTKFLWKGSLIPLPLLLPLLLPLPLPLPLPQSPTPIPPSVQLCLCPPSMTFCKFWIQVFQIRFAAWLKREKVWWKDYWYCRTTFLWNPFLKNCDIPLIKVWITSILFKLIYEHFSFY